MVNDTSKSGDILKVVTAAILEVAEGLSQVASTGTVSNRHALPAGNGCQSGGCPVSWKPRRTAAA